VRKGGREGGRKGGREGGKEGRREGVLFVFLPAAAAAAGKPLLIARSYGFLGYLR